MMLSVNLSGIKRRQVKIDDDLEDRFFVGFEIMTDDFDKAVDLAKDLQENLENNLKGQTVLKKEG